MAKFSLWVIWKVFLTFSQLLRQLTCWYLKYSFAQSSWCQPIRVWVFSALTVRKVGSQELAILIYHFLLVPVCVCVRGWTDTNVCRWQAELNFRCHSVGTSHLVFLLEGGSLTGLAFGWYSLTRCLEIPRDLPVCITLSMPRTAGITGLRHHTPFFLSHWFWAANSVPRLARQASFSLTEPSR